MDDRFEAGGDPGEKRSGQDEDESGRRTGDEDEWEDEAEAGGAGSGEWVEEVPADAPTEWVEDKPDDAGKPKPKEAPAYVTWIAGVIGLLIGLFAFRSCGQ